MLIWLVAVLAAGGCGASHRAAGKVERKATPTPRAGYPVGVVGPLTLDVQGVSARHGRLDQVAGNPLVLVDARVATSAEVADTARANPISEFAIVGASARAEHVPNLAGIVLKDSDAAYLAGVTAGLAASTAGGGERVAWVGPEERPLAAAFTRGVRAAARGVTVLRQWTRNVPALCKEAALTSLDRGAVLVMAHGGLCAAAAADAAHEQNVPGLRLDDFLLPSVAAGVVAREASSGVFHGGQDVVFGADSGAVGVRTLDPRISLSIAAQVRAAAQRFAGTSAQGG